MRIVVDDIAASKTGALSILKDFYNYVLNCEKEHEWIFVLGDDLLEEKENVKVLIRKDVKQDRINRLRFDLKTGSEYFSQLKPDVLFSLQNTLPGGYKGPQVLYVHQPLGYQTLKKFSLLKSEEREYAIYQYFIGRLIDSSVKRADKVIVQTEWMKRAVIKKTGISEDKIVKVLPDIIVPFETDEEVRSYENGNTVNFFYPAGEILYKNHACIIEAVGILREKGIYNFSVSFTMDKGDLTYLNRYPSYEQIKYIGRIPRKEVFGRYRDEVLIFPSYIETFGYPPAEARAMGGNIIASDCEFCREVLRGYDKVTYFDPFKPEQLANVMEDIIIHGIKYITDIKENSDMQMKVDKGCSWQRVAEIIKSVKGAV
ncbi:MAG: glycosyltransferase [Lachnospiraceae bacterium]|nr:glycosyltransferase [Lachnospiraceae bacterium]